MVLQYLFQKKSGWTDPLEIAHKLRPLTGNLFQIKELTGFKELMGKGAMFQMCG